MNLTEFFKAQGYDTSEYDNWSSRVNVWKSWYEGVVKSFHYYTIYTGTNRVNVKRRSLQMAKKVCEDWADLLFNERVDIKTDNNSANEVLNDVLTKNDFWVLCNQLIEKTFAMGTGAFVLDVTNYAYDDELQAFTLTDDTSVRIQTVSANKIYPLSWDTTGIKECAFVTNRTENGKNYTIVNMHTLNEYGNYVIRNYLFEDNQGSLKAIDNEQMQKEFDTRSNIKWFIILKPNICNNIKEDSPFGLSVYANSVDVLESTDIAFDGIPNEFLLGRKRIFIDKDLTTVDTTTGETIPVFDVNDTLFYVLPSELNSSNNIGLMDNTQQLRITEHIDGVQVNLDLLSDKCGFGKGYYKFDTTGVTTATQVISENSKLFRTLKKHEIILESVLYDLVNAIAYISTTFAGQPMTFTEITVDFDDSIIEDKTAERQTDRQEVASGIMSRLEYRMKWYNETEEEARKNLPEAVEEIE